MPGGAPLKKRAASKRPCKYGARDADGLCPKKPRAAKAAKKTTARKKPPCKYGPRDADGYCPKKPRNAAAAAAVTLATPGKTAAERAHAKKTLARKTTSTVSQAAQAGVSAGITELHRQTLGTAKRRAATKAALKSAGKKIASGAAYIAPRAAAAGAVLMLAGGGGADWSAARKWAKQQIAETEARLKRKLTKAERDPLFQQYQAYHVATIQKRKR